MEELPILLDDLKSTVECLSMSSQTSTWEVCGGLDRLYSIMMKIFRHGCLLITSNDKDAVWNFVQGINWLHPTMASPSTFFKNLCQTNEHLDKSSIWVYKSLENHTLSEKLGWLLSDKSHLYKYYKPEAFLCQKTYSDAAILCLKVVELNQPSLLLEINPKLYLNYSSKNQHCTTLPKSLYKQKNNHYSKQFGSLTNSLKCKSFKNNDQLISSKCYNNLPCYNDKQFFKNQCHKSWPDIYLINRPILRRSISFDMMHIPIDPLDYSNLTKTVHDSKVIPKKLLDVNYEELLYDNVDSNKDQMSKENKLLYNNNKRRSKLLSLPLRTLEESDDDTQSNISDGSKTLIPYDEFPPSKYTGTSGLVSAYFPGQDLFKFLSSGQFVQANAELDRENAHFKISEAIIETIEQIKCNQKLNFINEVFEENDDDINRSKLRIRNRQRLLEAKATQSSITSSSDCLTESTLTDHTMSSLTSSYCSTTSSMSTTDDMDEFDLDNESNCSLSINSSVSSLYSNVDSIISSNAAVTAESVARSLIRHISHHNKWPVNVNVQWMVSENEAPQQILPLPSSWPVNPHEKTDSKSSSRLRGTSDWAPPRPQIIFTCHPAPIRKKLMEQQGYRCAGCGVTVALKYASKFRYCFYLGRYFCTGCHINKTAIIPGRIITKWDFSKYRVSNDSFALLEQMLFDPLFNIADLNNILYRRVQGLDRVRSYRQQLYYIKDFIFSCRFANRLKELLDEMETHIFLKPDWYSIQNFVDVKNGELSKQLQCMIVACNKHITNCQMCQARGFVCELCSKNKVKTKNEVLFPWDFTLVIRCQDCGSCYHKKCFNSRKVSTCPRCPRIKAKFKRSDC